MQAASGTRLRNASNAVLLWVIAVCCSFAAVCPEDVLAALGLAPERWFLPLLLVSVLSATLCFLLVAGGLLLWVWRRMAALRGLHRQAQATVAVEFLLVLPLLMSLLLTVFSLAEIAHAQLVFRYAAFCAARSGVVSDQFLHWPPKIGPGLMIYSLADADKTRMRAAAVGALASIDGYSFGDSSGGTLKSFVVQDLAQSYYRASAKTPDWGRQNAPWVGAGFYAGQFADADRALTGFTAKCEYPSWFNRPPENMIKDLLRTFTVDKIKTKSESSSWVSKLLATITKAILNGLLTPVDGLIDLLLRKSGISELLQKVPNPVAPPMVSVQMSYELRLRPGSLFWLIGNKGKNGYVCLTLRRVANSKDNSALLMQSTGGRIDMPLIPPLIKKVNLMPGDSTF